MTAIASKNILFLLGVLVAVASSFAPVSFSQSPNRCTSLNLADEVTSESSEIESEPSTPPSPPVKCPDCDLCDGSGRIEGGIGTVLTWWPIKAYRPCPNFIDRGGFYQRSGQGLDEIAFGRDSTFDSSGK